MISRSELCEALDYDPTTGAFTWKKRVARCIRVGDVAGNLQSDGYIRIRLRGRNRSAHRLAWLYEHGEWPELEIDHADGNPSNNRISNLRLATTSQNQANRTKKRLGTSSRFKGVCWLKNKRRWRAKQHVVGLFKSEIDAHQAYVTAAKELFGEFANPGQCLA